MSAGKFLLNVFDKTLYRSTNTYNIIWKTLVQHLTGVDVLSVKWGTTLRTSKKNTLRTSICIWWCSKCLSTILKVMERTGVSIGMFQTSHLSFDARRTECVGQTIFSVMTPVSKKNTKTIAGKTLRESGCLFRCQNACFMCWCSICLSTILY